MSAELHELRRARKRRPLPIPGSACVVWNALGGGAMPSTVGGITFSLRNRRAGPEVWLHASGYPAFSWNLTAMLNHKPADFAAARKWVRAYVAGYGQTVEEAPPRRPRMKRPNGADAKLLKAGGCKESWLSSDVPTLWAEAMMRCGHAGGHCGQDGFCHYGDCDMQMDVPARHEDDEADVTP